MNIDDAVEKCAKLLGEYQKQVAKLTLSMQSELLRLKKKIKDLDKPQIIYLERERTGVRKHNKKQTRNKFLTIDSFGQETYFATKRQLLESLDITEYELQQHLKGNFTVLDDLQIKVEKL